MIGGASYYHYYYYYCYYCYNCYDCYYDCDYDYDTTRLRTTVYGD